MAEEKEVVIVEEKLGIKNVKELIAGLKLLGITGMKIAADKKIGVDDIPHVVSMASEFSVLVDAVKDIDELWAEIKDIDEAEVMELMGEMIMMVKAIKSSSAV